MKLKRMVRYNLLKIVRLREEPKQVAMSVAIGTSIMFMPFFGFGIFIAYFAAMILKVNKIATILTTIVWKLALPLFYLLNYVTGSFVMGSRSVPAQPIHEAVGFLHRFKMNFHAIGTDFLVGSAINSILAGILSYYIALKLLELRKKRKYKKAIHKKMLKEEE